MKSPQSIAELLLSIDVVTFRFNPPYTFTSGLKSPIYLDNRLVMSSPDAREKIVAAYVEAMEKHIGLSNIDVISGTATAAIPQASWIAAALHLPMVYVRPSAKAHGKQKQLEGYFKKGSKVVIVEDHISTGQSSIGNAQVIRDEGGIVEYCIATTDYETKASQDNFRKHNIKRIALVTGKQIVDEAEKRGMLTKKEAQSVYSWLDDSVAWGKYYA
ncbi:orotate phosphoribosyltransferase [Candidatus Roizmanbacteria bacterium RIFCSPHIGHO2_12_FULL_44_10]|uniref:Orotate phosphoribosyltransferase n=1 Tax=Candidatus Roizmanbacteria bacterium RIFCSPHIGHO2_12_FULL_44_10 TaxID=1802054 RepID=A0A1F7I6Q1_9BACT|nr:MAG: orotate phosphoribosyltransferase [Candidatus Roizmanbacteria bacterium RIFCSPHIGHO2_12_FULL_44_10]